MLACARIGAIALGGVRRLLARSRSRGASSMPVPRSIITADERMRGGKACRSRRSSTRPLRKVATRVKTVIVVQAHRRHGHHDSRPRHLAARADGEGLGGLPSRTGLNAEHPLFILYTSGSTGKPKGVRPHHRRLSAVGHALTHK